jgi:hypothetical protein
MSGAYEDISSTMGFLKQRVDACTHDKKKILGRFLDGLKIDLDYTEERVMVEKSLSVSDSLEQVLVGISGLLDQENCSSNHLKTLKGQLDDFFQKSEGGDSLASGGFCAFSNARTSDFAAWCEQRAAACDDAPEEKKFEDLAVSYEPA